MCDGTVALISIHHFPTAHGRLVDRERPEPPALEFCGHQFLELAALVQENQRAQVAVRQLGTLIAVAKLLVWPCPIRMMVGVA